jgi:hypothetical protein
MDPELPPEELTRVVEVSKPTAPPTIPKRMTLEALLEGIPEGACFEEIDWGPPRGAEF